MSLLPRSRKARRRLLAVAVIAPVLAASTGLTLYALRDGVSFFYTPAQAKAAELAPGRTVRLGGLVRPGSVVKGPDGGVVFVVMDEAESLVVHYRGDLPDLFREGQGVVCQGTLRPDGGFEAREVLAKHDENYMPRELVDGLKESGEWRGGGAARTPA
ncbi:MAG TPA: cytochrome c maturation protein CcmE [Caulobacteraceae bacterium]|jgi:cytochrome c-type biogenesis protein CcmE